jgi:O-methyltransferase involved in polyketide biosynthesis
LLQSSAQGVTKYVEADLRDPDKILQGAAETLDFNEPVAITLLMILMLIEDEDAYEVVSRLMAAVPSGSYLAISHPAGDVDSGGEISKAYERLEKLMPDRPTLRGKDQIARFFDGLEMVEPGLVQLHRWRPDPGDADSVLHYDVPAYAGVGRKP